MSQLRQIPQLLLVLVAIAGIVGYQNQARHADRLSTRIFFCNELETIKKGERAEKAQKIARTLKYIEDVRHARRKPIPGITNKDIQEGLASDRQRLRELRTDIQRCLKA